MRIIQFRAYIHSMQGITPISLIDFNLKIIQYLVVEGHDEIGVEECSFEDCEIMQFTGLLDKNGKKIYDGDFIAHSTQLNKPCKVVYHEGCFVGTPGDYPFFTEWSKEFLETEMEVIGNIYENPEFLIK